jgi:hypothetical protein
VRREPNYLAVPGLEAHYSPIQMRLNQARARRGG